MTGLFLSETLRAVNRHYWFYYKALLQMFCFFGLNVCKVRIHSISWKKIYKKTETAISESKWKLHNWGDRWLVSRWQFNEGITEHKLNKSWVFSHKICGPELTSFMWETKTRGNYPSNWKSSGWCVSHWYCVWGAETSILLLR